MDKISSLVRNAMAAELLIVGYDHGMLRHLKEPISGTVQCKFEQGICQRTHMSPNLADCDKGVLLRLIPKELG